MSLGKFADNGAVYEINTPETPGNWSNYLFNDNYYTRVSQTAQGVSQASAPVFMEYTRGTRHFYLLDEGNERSYNTNCSNSDSKPDSYKCTHALGWSKIETTFGELDSSIRCFVPEKHAVEIWTYTVKNNSDQDKNISLFSSFSLSLRGATGINAGFDPEQGMIEATGLQDAVFYDDYEKNKKGQRYIFHFSTQKPASFDCSERRFFGSNNLSRTPVAVKNGRCSNTIAEKENTIAAFQHRLTLEPGESRQVHLIMGCSSSVDFSSQIQKVLKDDLAIEKEFAMIVEYWEKVCSAFTVQTPDSDFNYFINYWLKKQVNFSSRLNRGCCIFPIRNSLQDAVAYSMLDGEFAKKKISELTALQTSDGYLHMWQVSKAEPEVGKIGMNHLKHKDGQVWLICCVCDILDQTGELKWLDTSVPYADNGVAESLYNHLLKAVDYMENDCGAHGLSLMGDGDWNDPLNGAGRLGRGESTWTTMGFKYSLMKLLPIAELRNDMKSVKRFEILIEKLDKVINDHCWDGNWYIAGFDDEGVPFGKAADDEGKILLNSQSWAILSGVARGERLEKLLKTIDGIDSPVGPQTITPAFTKWNPVWGRISLWIPGSSENGGVYSHAAMFKAYADCLTNRGDKAYETIKKIMPTNPENPPEKNGQCPIFVPNCYFGLPDSPNFGRSTNNLVTGTAAWMMWLGLEHILGVQSTINGLKITPCMPEEWKEVTIRRNYRGAEYNITIKRNGTENNLITVNGKRLSGKTLPVESGSKYDIQVLIK